VLIMVISIPLSLLSGAGSRLSCGGRGDPKFNDYVGRRTQPSPSASG
jgi:hypothetical protein